MWNRLSSLCSSHFSDTHRSARRKPADHFLFFTLHTISCRQIRRASVSESASAHRRAFFLLSVQSLHSATTADVVAHTIEYPNTIFRSYTNESIVLLCVNSFAVDRSAKLGHRHFAHLKLESNVEPNDHGSVQWFHSENHFKYGIELSVDFLFVDFYSFAAALQHPTIDDVRISWMNKCIKRNNLFVSVLIRQRFYMTQNKFIRSHFYLGRNCNFVKWE